MTRSALSNPNFRRYLLGSTVSLHGLWIYRVALAWYAWQLAQSEFWVGIVAFMQFAPAILLGPLFGVLADRLNRQKASVVINALNLLVMLVLGVLVANEAVDIYLLCAFAFLSGALDGAHSPVRMTLVPNLVHKEQLQSAIASNSIAFNVSRFVGPVIAGIVIAQLGVAAAFLINSLSYLAIIIAVCIIDIRPRTIAEKRSTTVWQEMGAGLQYTRKHNTIRDILLMIGVTSIFARGVLEMMPVFADIVFQRGSVGLAILTSALGAGAILSGILLTRRTDWLGLRTIQIAVVCSGIAMIVLSYLHNFSAAIVLIVVLGFALSICGVGSQIVIQSRVADNVRGRVSSLWALVAFGGTASGSLLIGYTASVYGLQTVTAMAGAIALAISLVALFQRTT